MAPAGFTIEPVARDGFARSVRARVGDLEFVTPGVLQAVSESAPADGKPPCTLRAGQVGAPSSSVPFRWGPSPLFPDGDASAQGVTLPRLLPKAYALGALVDPADLVVEQGGIAGALPSRAGAEHLRPLAKSASLVALQNLTELRGKPREFVRAVAGARDALGPRPLLFAASVADPASVALLAYLGADLVDDFQGLVAASAGAFLYNFGAVAGGVPGACHCAGCVQYFGDATESVAARNDDAEPQGGEARPPSGDEHDLARELGEGRGAASRRNLQAVDAASPLFKAALAHNRRAIAAESRIAHRAIAEGTLREVVESRVRAYPWLVAALRNLDREFYGAMEALTPIWKPRLHAVSHESLQRPEVRRWGERLESRYKPPPSVRVLLFVPCSARKPYSLSQTQRAIDRALSGVRPSFAVHRVVVTSPLGLVPEELERVFPAAHYDIPVTGDWAFEEVERIETQAKSLVASHHYKAVVSLVGDDLPHLQHALPGTIECAAKGRAWAETLTSAADAVRASLGGERDLDPRARTLEDLASIARFQFGSAAGDALVAGAQVKGRYPWSRLFAAKEQLAQHVPDRGRLALTLAGARRVAAAGAYRVEVENFELKGDIFAVGVKAADGEIRSGDSVAVVQGGAVAAAGFARMGASEMMAMRRGVAVDIRHKA